MLRVLRAATEAVRSGDAAALAVVIETEGSTYSRAGTLALFTGRGHTGWLSGGCLEPEIECRAMASIESGRIGWLEIDTRNDEAFFAGTAIGCRGRQRLALLPLNRLDGVGRVFDEWLNGQHALQLHVDTDGRVRIETPSTRGDWHLDASPIDWDTDGHRYWSCTLPRPPHALVFGAGPEAPMLVPLLHGLGWPRRPDRAPPPLARCGHRSW